jgi:RNA polymerase sigma-70 factor, ECF subfamily
MGKPGKTDFDTIIEENYPRLHRSISAYLAGSSVEPDDILQETFLKAWKNIEDFKGGSGVYTWLYSIARNICIDEFRKRKYENKISNKPVEEYELAFDQFTDKDNHEEILMLRKAISELPDLLRTIVVLKSIDGLTYPEIEEITGVNQQTLKNRMFRARKELADILKKKGVDQT